MFESLFLLCFWKYPAIANIMRSVTVSATSCDACRNLFFIRLSIFADIRFSKSFIIVFCLSSSLSIFSWKSCSVCSNCFWYCWLTANKLPFCWSVFSMLSWLAIEIFILGLSVVFFISSIKEDCTTNFPSSILLTLVL